MKRTIAGALLLLASLLLPHTARANITQFHCPAGYVCSRAMGLAVRPAAGWVALPAGAEGPCSLAFGRRSTGLDYDERLIVKVVEIGKTARDRALAHGYALRLVHSVHASRATLTNTTFGGAPAVVIRGMPPTPRLAIRAVIAHAAIVYLVTAPGSSLGHGQRAALASLRFFGGRAGRCPL
jgi:hypothetical protein